MLQAENELLERYPLKRSNVLDSIIQVITFLASFIIADRMDISIISSDPKLAFTISVLIAILLLTMIETQMHKNKVVATIIPILYFLNMCSLYIEARLLYGNILISLNLVTLVIPRVAIVFTDFTSKTRLTQYLSYLTIFILLKFAIFIRFLDITYIETYFVLCMCYSIHLFDYYDEILKDNDLQFEDENIILFVLQSKSNLLSRIIKVVELVGGV